MSTLQLYAESAIRRDLARARTLLSAEVRLGPQRRHALVDHLVWLTSLVQPGTTGVSPAAAAVRDRANEFRPEGFGPEREEVVRALLRFEQAVAELHCWTATDVVRIAQAQLPWVLDSLDPRGGPGLVLPATDPPETVRSRAAEYRRTRALLWGTVALQQIRVPARVGAVSVGR